MRKIVADNKKKNWFYIKKYDILFKRVNLRFLCKLSRVCVGKNQIKPKGDLVWQQIEHGTVVRAF